MDKFEIPNRDISKREILVSTILIVNWLLLIIMFLHLDFFEWEIDVSSSMSDNLWDIIYYSFILSIIPAMVNEILIIVFLVQKKIIRGKLILVGNSLYGFLYLIVAFFLFTIALVDA